MGESGARYAPADRVADRVRSMHFVGLRRLLRCEATKARGAPSRHTSA